ncbi:propionyl-CoA synthetase [Herbaspirillum rubrisubalbicans]|uniref:Propionyl-CoA synthetase n=1 Tax=Herbaspirillum rubrisubalbicans TaxID=80842 RepID=A0ABX9C3V4_9BURK|nr:propionate--CoA ligase [Herbaspirillum rubrisubalbicans]RAM65056.1 propionyl-CoA synthetase [Herbaspirillum rubrisubalbicans]RAN48297.1 propionyl-CoA synthetase [Herbaspirillum rubrisubalbicans]
MQYEDFYRRSIEHPDTYWAEEAQRIHWETPFTRTLDYSRAPFARWFIGGTTNLCYNAVDRHLAERPTQAALIAISTETNSERVYDFAELHREVQAMAATMLALGVQRGDRVLIYMPMVAEAVFAMLACARIGAVHSVVFGGFASNSLASRIDDAQPRLIVSADAGSRGGKVIPYKGLLDEAINLAQHKPQRVLLVDRGLAEMARTPQRDVDYAQLRQQHLDQPVPVTWLESNDTSYVLYTSGTTGKPKGVQRDVGGYAVALASSMQHIFCGQPGETYFCTSDIGWVVGHSYIVYGPLIAGMATVLYEGLPIRPDAGIWWSIVEKYKVSRMFSAPTAIRVLKKQPPECMERYDTSSLKALYLAGEPLDETTSSWISGALKVPVIDNYWQTESGWPIISIAKGISDKPTRLGSPGVPMPGYRLAILDEATGEPCAAGQKGVVAIEGPLPPGCMQTVYGDDARFVNTYWRSLPREVYSTFDWGIRDADGYYFILGRTDDVINVAGHRLGTREIEESISSHPNVSEVAVVGVEDKLKGQVAFAFAIPKQADAIATPEQRKALEAEIMGVVDKQIGAVGRPARVFFVSGLPKTRSGKLLRRAIQSICEGRDAGDLPTIEDPAALEQVRAALRD